MLPLVLFDQIYLFLFLTDYFAKDAKLFLNNSKFFEDVEFEREKMIKFISC